MLFHLRMLCLLLVPTILSTAQLAPAPAVRAAGELRARTIVSAQPPALELAAHIPGPISALDVQGPLAALLDGSELWLLNVANPAQPREISHLVLPNPSLLHDIKLAANRAYISWGECDGLTTCTGGLRIVDTSDPTAPVEIGAIALPEVVSQVVVEGQYAYLLCENSGTRLRVYDMANPAIPVALATFDALLANTMRVLHDPATGRLNAYLTGGLGTTVVDLSDPATPTVRGIYRSMHGQVIGGDIYTTRVNGSPKVYAYLADTADSGGGLRIVDLTDPINPIELAQLTTWGKTYRVAIAGHYAFIINDGPNYTDVQHVLDLTNPTAPSQVNTNASHPFFSFANQAPYAFFGTSAGLEISMLPDQGSPTIVGTFAGVVGPIAIVGRLIVTAFDHDLVITDAFNPVAPRRLSELPLSETSITSVVAAGSYAVVVDLAGNLSTVDISDPASPRLVGAIKLPAQVWDLQLRGIPGSGAAFAFVGGTQGSFDIVDLSQPATPLRIGTYTVSGAIRSIAISGTIAYLVTSFDVTTTLITLDIANPTHPISLGSIPLGNTMLDATIGTIVISGSYAYISIGQDGLQVVNVADPARPRLAERLSFPRARLVYGLAVVGSILYVGAQPDLLLALDLSNPAAPAIAATYPAPGLSGFIAMANEYLYVPRRMGGVSLWSLGEHSGSVQDVNGRPVAGAEIAVDNQLASATGMPGSYRLAGQSAGMALASTLTLTPRLAGYTFWPASRAIAATANASDQNFTLLPAPITGVVDPGQAATLLYTDTQGLPTRIDIPAGTVTTETVFTITPTVGIANAAVAFAGHAFELTQRDTTASDVRFSHPLTVTIAYSIVDARLVRDRAQLALWWWNGSAWEDAAADCQASVQRDLGARRVQIPICHAGRYVLVGPTNRTYLPITRRST